MQFSMSFVFVLEVQNVSTLSRTHHVYETFGQRRRKYSLTKYPEMETTVVVNVTGRTNPFRGVERFMELKILNVFIVRCETRSCEFGGQKFPGDSNLIKVEALKYKVSDQEVYTLYTQDKILKSNSSVVSNGMQYPFSYGKRTITIRIIRNTSLTLK